MEIGVKRDDGTWFMHAYWFAFNATGEAAIDAVLSSVAWAGKAYHSTEHWSDDRDGAPSHTDQIQAAADAAAAEIARLRAELEEAQTLLKQMRDALAPGESTTWNFLVNTLGVDFADDWHRDLRAANYELEEARALSAKLRDQFAMAIAGGELASQSRDWGGYLPGNEGQFAERVWKLTDAVLAARAEGRG